MQSSQKLPRALPLAKNWKEKEMRNVQCLRDEMIGAKIKTVLIEEFVSEEYNRIEAEHNRRVQKYHDKLKSPEEKKITRENNKAREKAVQFIIKNKAFLEEKGYNKEYIDKYVEKHYNFVNMKYNNNVKYKDTIDFID